MCKLTLMHEFCAVEARYVSKCRLRIPYLNSPIDLSKNEHIYNDRRRVYRTERRTWLRGMRDNRANKYIVVMVVVKECPCTLQKKITARQADPFL